MQITDHTIYKYRSPQALQFPPGQNRGGGIFIFHAHLPRKSTSELHVLGIVFWKEFADRYSHNAFKNKNKSHIFYPYLFTYFYALTNIHERDWHTWKAWPEADRVFYVGHDQYQCYLITKEYKLTLLRISREYNFYSNLWRCQLFSLWATLHRFSKTPHYAYTQCKQNLTLCQPIPCSRPFQPPSGYSYLVR